MVCHRGETQLMSFHILLRQGNPSEGSWKGSHRVRRRDWVTINTLPNDILLEIFYFYLRAKWSTEWHTLVHVCQRWRDIVFASPRRLNLRLVYTGKRPMYEMLDIWPALPVAISLNTYPSSKSHHDRFWGNMAAALESEHNYRICEIDLICIPASHWERLATAMQKPFPELKHLEIWVEGNTVMSLPDSFLGGSAPLLRRVRLGNCPFPGMPKLLLSANHLVTLSLWIIPDSGYFSPQALGTALSVMSRLETLRVDFRSSRYPTSRPRPPLTRSVFPALIELVFEGVHEYLEDLLAQIEAPLLKKLEIIFFMNLEFVVPQLHRLIGHAESFKTCHRAIVDSSDRGIRFAVFREETHNHSSELFIAICGVDHLDRQLSSLVQLFSSSFLLLSALVRLDVEDPVHLTQQLSWKDYRETTQWLELLAWFTAVKDLRLSNRVGRHICEALEGVTEEKVKEVLPALQNIFLSGLQPSESVPEFIEGFVAMRQNSGHPIAVHPWVDRGYHSPFL
ncbi:hypothetical protein F5148DRAFT_623997 [Russula earlei]|uniref:Uncharacterized protein n=1 Tax=Russula earlei TaxID=71964 RepID=A0ACC0UEQ4_9AGAM|nr:hypothetical protein F5148DRAFT_623997 [Russula earlei]